VLAITTYITASVAYLFLPMIPDMALFRDRLGGRVSAWKSWLYDVLSVRWQGNASQWRSLGAVDFFLRGRENLGVAGPGPEPGPRG